jgi:hypothetical protein
MEFLAQNWGWLIGIFSTVGVFGGALYRVSIRGTVHKHELYEKNGQPIYQHRTNCKEITHSFTTCLGEIKDSMDALEKTLQQDRIASIGFMSAVKEKLDLKFTIPKT